MKNIFKILTLVIFCQINPSNIVESQVNFKGTTAGTGITTNRSSANALTGPGTITSVSRRNFNSFSISCRKPDRKWALRNQAYIHHPDYDFIDKYYPSEKAVEIFEKRTKNSKFFVDEDNDTKFYQVESNGALHYQKNGQWLTIDERLESKGNNRFEASHQEEPVGFDASRQKAYIKSLQGTVYFNNWSLFGRKNGKDNLLSNADWSHYTAGDDGLYISGIFPGIDMEMKAGRGTIKTSFILRKNEFPQFDALVFKDKFEGSFINGFTPTASTSEADYRVNGENALHLSPAIVYAENNAAGTLTSLNYALSDNELSLTIESSYLNKYLPEGSVILDPLVSTTNRIDQAEISGSMDCGSPDNSCNYSLQVPTPVASTITGVYFKFGFQTVGQALNRNGFWSISSGSCKLNCGANPDSTKAYNSPGTTDTRGKFADISPYFLNCMPSPSCASQNITFTLGFFNNICGGSTTCSNSYIMANQPFVVMLEGHTVEVDSVSSASICKGEEAKISATAHFGVPPYSYKWNTGETTSSINVSPTSTTSYQVTVTDHCGNTSTGNGTVTVRQAAAPATPVAGSNSPVCENSSINLKASTIPGVTYSWTGPDNFTSNLQNPVINNAQTYFTGKYLVKASINGCSSKPDSILVSVKTSNLALSISSNSQTLCEGSSVTFTASPTNGGTNPVYTWYVNGANTGKGGNTYSSISLSNNDVVNCTMVSNAGGCIPPTTVTSNSIKVKTIVNNNPKGTVTDIEGNTYKTVVIGNQEWMAENLKTTQYNDGTPIPNVTDNTSWTNLTKGAYCVYDNNPKYKNIYGLLYNWYTVSEDNLCPANWRVPTSDDWGKLTSYLDKNGYDYNNNLTQSAKSLASATGWTICTTLGTPGNDPTSNNKSGFTALPSGARSYNGKFDYSGNECFWWNSTTDANGFISRGLEYNCVTYILRQTSSTNGSQIFDSNDKNTGLSIRCVRDINTSYILPISLSADKKEICQGDSVVLTAKTCGGTAPYKYLWSCGGKDSSVISTRPGKSNWIHVTVTDFNNHTNSDSVFITVKYPTSSVVAMKTCGSYTLNGQTYTKSGDYTQILTNAVGCDSTITLHLVINKPTLYELTRTACSSFTLNNQEYTSSGKYTQTLTNAAGCDSTIILHLTISNNSQTSDTLSVSACKNYTLNGYLYTESGTYTQTLRNSSGCDSTIILYLKVNQPTSSTASATICQGESYNFAKSTYSSAGTYTVHLTNSAGCDSTATLNLKVAQPTSSITKTTICQGESFSFNGKTYTTEGTYNVHLTNAEGCDSAATLILKTARPSSSTTKATICQGQNYKFNGSTYDTTGNYAVHLTNAAGCDSTATLILKVAQPTKSTTNISICKGQSINFIIGFYSDPGTYTFNLTNAAGCDSVVTLNLKVNQPSSSITNVNICQGESYDFNKATYATSGTYSVHFINSAGCDSTATLVLKVGKPQSSTSNASICRGNSYNFAGINYNSAGNYTAHLHTYLGCDSTANLILSVREPSASMTTSSLCRGNTYHFNGKEYADAGTFTTHLTNAAGCDSAATLILTVKEPTSFIKKDTIDQGQSYQWKGNDYSQQGTYTEHLTNAAGCDSTLTLVLTVNEIPLGIPKFFTPNGDGFNDTWVIGKINLFPDAEIYIFDRYGKPLAHYKSQDPGWNGYYNGKLMPPDDYWYQIILHQDDKKYTGHFTLVR
ncbi:MAG: FISUMP domain-containing protein [Bacteroidota bacterium]|nr:FISUMP domain-containing protein [Bacteroidota bacterium]